MQVGVVHMTTRESSGGYSAMVCAAMERATQDGTELVHRWVRHLRRATDSATAYPMLLNGPDIVDEVVGLADAGVDAVLIACSGDPALAEARSLVDIPVIGPMEAALGLATGYGWKFGLVTVDDRTWSTHLDQLVHAYRFEPRYIGMRTLRTPTARIFTEGFRDPAVVVADIVDRSRELADDGADVVLIGSGGLCAFAAEHGITRVDGLDVPIIDMLTVGVKFAEIRAELTAKTGLPPTSRSGWYGRFPDADRVRVDGVFERRARA